MASDSSGGATDPMAESIGTHPENREVYQKLFVHRPGCRAGQLPRRLDFR